MRFQSVYGVFPRGWGKCVSGNTYLFSDKGIIKIKDLFNCEENGIEDYTKKLDIKLLNKEQKLEEIDRGTYNGYKDTKIIRTKSGYEIECSNNHPLIIDIDGNEAWLTADRIRVGDKVKISLQNDIWGTNTVMPDIDRKAVIKRNVNVKLPKKLDKDLGRFFGYIWGGCSIEGNYALKVVTDDSQIINDINKIIMSRFNLPKNPIACIYEDEEYYKIKSPLFTRYLNLLGFRGRGKLEIPDFILKAPREIVIEFLKGFCSINMFLNKTGLKIPIYHNERRKQIRLMLLNLGIKATEHKAGTVHLKLDKDNALLFAKIVGFCGENSDIRYKLVGLNNEIIDDYLEDRKELLGDSYYKFDDEVIKITDSKAHVYDVSMPETHSFVSNGFISHNTWGEVISLFLTAILYPRNYFILNSSNKRKCGCIIK